jgi:hypothetical protein
VQPQELKPAKPFSVRVYFRVNPQGELEIKEYHDITRIKHGGGFAILYGAFNFYYASYSTDGIVRIERVKGKKDEQSSKGRDTCPKQNLQDIADEA